MPIVNLILRDAEERMRILRELSQVVYLFDTLPAWYGTNRDKGRDTVKSFMKTLMVIASFCVVLVLAGCQGSAGEEVGLDELDVDGGASFYALVIGNDSRIGTVDENNGTDHAQPPFRSDTIILAQINPITYQIGLITVPRDTAVEMDGEKVKLNETYRLGGQEGLVKEVEQLTGVDIKYYLDMDFLQFENFIDAFDNVEANVPLDMSMKDITSGKTISLTAGTQELNGAEALVLARERKAYAEEQDASRQIQNRQIVQVATQKVLDNPLQAAANVDILLENMETDWESAELLAMVMDFVENAEKVTFISGTGPYSGSIDSATERWIIQRDEATWSKVIAAVEKGEDPTKIVSLPNVKAAESS